MAGGRKRGRGKKQENDKDEDKNPVATAGKVVEEGTSKKKSKLSTKKKDSGGTHKYVNQLDKLQKDTDDDLEKCKTQDQSMQHDQNSDEFSLSQCPSSQMPLSQAAKFVPSFGKRKKSVAVLHKKLSPTCDILQEEVASTEFANADADEKTSEMHVERSGDTQERVSEKEKSSILEKEKSCTLEKEKSSVIEKEKSNVSDKEKPSDNLLNISSQESHAKTLQDTAISDSTKLKAENTLQTKQSRDDKTKSQNEKEDKETVDVADETFKDNHTFSNLKCDKMDCSDQQVNIQIMNDGTETPKLCAHPHADGHDTPKGNKDDISVSEEIKTSPLFEAVCKLEEEMSNAVKNTDGLIGCSVTPPEGMERSINEIPDEDATEQLKIGFPNIDDDFVALCSKTNDGSTMVQETIDKFGECGKDMKNDESLAKTLPGEDDDGKHMLEDQSKSGISTSLPGTSNVTCYESRNDMQVVDDFTDITDSQLCMIEEDWQTTSKSETANMEQGSVKKMREPVYVSMPTKYSLPADDDKGTKMAQGLIKELTSLNRMVLNAKREMEAVKKQRQQRLKRSTNQKSSTTSKGYGTSSNSFI